MNVCGVCVHVCMHACVGSCPKQFSVHSLFWGLRLFHVLYNLMFSTAITVAGRDGTGRVGADSGLQFTTHWTVMNIIISNHKIQIVVSFLNCYPARVCAAGVK